MSIDSNAAITRATAVFSSFKDTGHSVEDIFAMAAILYYMASAAISYKSDRDEFYKWLEIGGTDSGISPSVGRSVAEASAEATRCDILAALLNYRSSTSAEAVAANASIDKCVIPDDHPLNKGGVPCDCPECVAERNGTANAECAVAVNPDTDADTVDAIVEKFRAAGFKVTMLRL